MTELEKLEIIEKFKLWFKNTLIANHKRNTLKLKNIDEFSINPFILYYLSNYLRGNSESKSLAEVLIYPRVLGTSITTSFGQNMQKFISGGLFSAYGSLIKGIDIEYVDQIDGRKKYCQLKSGPNALNYDDVDTIVFHFSTIKNLAKQNAFDLGFQDLVFALTYGERAEINAFVNALETKHITVLVGKEFWVRFTGDDQFYKRLIFACGEVAREVELDDIVGTVIEDLSKKVENRFKDLFN